MVTRCAVSLAALLVCLKLGVPASASDLFEKPIRLMADGKIIDTGGAWGHSGPTMEDLDGDGLPDLIVGDFGGKFRFYKNVGEPGKPVFTDRGNIQAGGEDAEVRIYCCVGSQARFVDLNGDGYRDFISNSYDPGHCYFFPGRPEGQFAAREELVDKAGVPVRSAAVQQQDYQSFGSFFSPVDWNGNGVFDLLIGCFEGSLKLRINEGTAQEPAFATENEIVYASDEPLKVDGHCCPVVADWDGDGLRDIITGSEDGSVTWFRNVGTPESPRFEKGVTLVAPFDGNGFDLPRWTEDQVVPGIRSQIEVVDFNGDGKLDLIVGDFCTAYELRTDLNDVEREQFDKLVAESQELSKVIADKLDAMEKEFKERYPGDAIYTDEAEKEWRKTYRAWKESPEYKARQKREPELVQRLRPFLSDTRRGDGDSTADLTKPHGYVWLFLRK